MKNSVIIFQIDYPIPLLYQSVLNYYNFITMEFDCTITATGDKTTIYRQ